MAALKDADGLTAKQKMFCEEYIANGYKALPAYFKVYGEKPDNPNVTYPYDLLRFPQVKAYIQKRREEIYAELHIDAIRIASELATMAFAEKDDETYGPNVKLKALEQLSKNLGLQTQKIENSGVIEVTLEDDLDDIGGDQENSDN